MNDDMMARFYFSAVAFRDKVYVLGGLFNSRVASNELFEISKSTNTFDNEWKLFRLNSFQWLTFQDLSTASFAIVPTRGIPAPTRYYLLQWKWLVQVSPQCCIIQIYYVHLGWHRSSFIYLQWHVCIRFWWGHFWNFGYWLNWTETLEWSQVTQQGDIPSPRRSHTAAVVNDQMIIFGGEGGKSYFDGVYSFDFGKAHALYWMKLSSLQKFFMNLF